MTDKVNTKHENGFVEKLAALLRSSLILGSALDAEAVGSTRGRSILNRFFTSKNAKQFFLKLKLSVGAAAERSVLLWLFEAAFNAFAGSSLRAASLFCFAFGGFITAVEALTYPSLLLSFHFTGTFVLGVLLLIVSLILFPLSKRTVSEALSDSVIVSFLFYDLFAVRKSKSAAGIPISELSVLTGLFFGAISEVFGAARVITVLLLIIMLYFIFTKPENGLLLFGLLCPFVPAKIIVILMSATALSTLFKLMRGKRALFGRRLDTLLWLLCLTVLLAGAVSFDRLAASETVMYLVMLLFALSTLVLVRSSDLLARLVRTLTVSAVAASLYTLAIMLKTTLIDGAGLTSFAFLLPKTALPFGGGTAFAAYLLCILPLMTAGSSTGSRIVDAIVFALPTLCLIGTGRLDALCILIVVSLILQMIRSPLLRYTTLIAVGAASAVCAVFPKLLTNAAGWIGVIQKLLPAEAPAADYTLSANHLLAGSGLGEEALPRALFFGANDGVTVPSNTYGFIFSSLGLIGGAVVLICLLPFIMRIIRGALVKQDEQRAPSARFASSVLCAVITLSVFALRVDLLGDIRVVSLAMLLLAGAACVPDIHRNEYICPYTPREEVQHGEA